MSLISSTNSLTSSGEFFFALTDSREDLFRSTDSLRSSVEFHSFQTDALDALSRSTETQIEWPETGLENREIIPTSYSKDLVDSAFKLTGFSAGGYYLSKYLTPFLTNQGFCLTNFLTKGMISTIWKINHFMVAPTVFLADLFGATDTQITIAMAPVVEEVQFRYILQQFLLKKLPESILQKISGNKELRLDSLPHKISRILFTSLLFTAMHLQYTECENTGGVPVFINGLIYSSIIETGDSILTPMCLHLINNQLALLGL